ncbi:hypothetical protein [Mycolicibacterium gadium]|uniref:Uncharacterized protein n=1 Tax=Mycolicibacterium gadium TaxID=1794 RepID=A0ABT6GVG0_MYCGU|nr:hypothetical protein [Mycolicibacterium gadium]MDG5485218.1 hypothetical protein [Mycolicibacterium gadium]
MMQVISMMGTVAAFFATIRYLNIRDMRSPSSMDTAEKDRGSRRPAARIGE